MEPKRFKELLSLFRGSYPVPVLDVILALYRKRPFEFFAAINIIGQSAFLLRIVQGSSHPGDVHLVYLFIAARVTGFILGDACTAFFLAKVDSSPLKLIARSEREKGMIYADIADAEGKRQIAEAEAEARILLIQLDVEQKRRDAEFLAAIKAKAFSQALGETPPAPSEPTRSRVYRGNT